MLETRQLTMQFGGLTAVSAVDLRVDKGQIYSIIGPNGAGKTTFFNAVTGIYEPTEGSVTFEGHSLRRPLTWKVLVCSALIGLVTGLLAALLAVNVNKLWRAAIYRTAIGTTQKFSYERMFQAARGYLFNELVIERIPRRATGFRIVSSDSKDDDKISMVLIEVPNEFEANAMLRNLNELRQMPGSPQIGKASEGDSWVVRDPAGNGVYAILDSQMDAEEFVKRLAIIRLNGEKRPRLAFLALIGGFLVGASGSFSVWSRSRRTADYIALGGIARTFQNIRLFQNMTVLENVLIGMDRTFRGGSLKEVLDQRNRRNPVMRLFGYLLVPVFILDRVLFRGGLGIALHMPWIYREEQIREAEAMKLLEFVNLSNRSGMLAKNLPYGDQRRLEIARAMASNPKLLLLDEPAAGMNPKETTDLMALIRRIRDRGITVLLIEHHMSLVMGISDRIAVLDYGVKIAEGTAEEVKNNPKVIEAYLGKEDVN